MAKPVEDEDTPPPQQYEGIELAESSSHKDLMLFDTLAEHSHLAQLVREATVRVAGLPAEMRSADKILDLLRDRCPSLSDLDIDLWEGHGGSGAPIDEVIALFGSKLETLRVYTLAKRWVDQALSMLAALDHLHHLVIADSSDFELGLTLNPLSSFGASALSPRPAFQLKSLELRSSSFLDSFRHITHHSLASLTILTVVGNGSIEDNGVDLSCFSALAKPHVQLPYEHHEGLTEEEQGQAILAMIRTSSTLGNLRIWSAPPMKEATAFNDARLLTQLPATLQTLDIGRIHIEEAVVLEFLRPRSSLPSLRRNFVSTWSDKGEMQPSSKKSKKKILQACSAQDVELWWKRW